MAKDEPQDPGSQGVYLVAAELASRGFVVAPAARGTRGPDLLVCAPGCAAAFSVRVLTNPDGEGVWSVGAEAEQIKAPSHLYVFVNFYRGRPRFYVVPSAAVAKRVKVETAKAALWYSFAKDESQRDNWEAFGRAG